MGRTEITDDARHRCASRYRIAERADWLTLLHATSLPLALVSLFATGTQTLSLGRTTGGALVGAFKVDTSDCKNDCWSGTTASTWKCELVVVHALVAVASAACLQAALVTTETCARSVAVRLLHSFALLAAAALGVSIVVFITSDGIAAQWAVVFALLASTAELAACAIVVRLSFAARHDAANVKPEAALDAEAAQRQAWEVSLFGTVLSVDVPQRRVSVLRRSMQPTRVSLRPEETIKLGEVKSTQPQQAEAPRIQSVPTRVSTVPNHRRQLSDESSISAFPPKRPAKALTLPPYSIIEESERPRVTTAPIRQSTAPLPVRPSSSPPPRYSGKTQSVTRSVAPRAQSVAPRAQSIAPRAQSIAPRRGQSIAPPLAQTESQRIAADHRSAPAKTPRRDQKRPINKSDISDPISPPPPKRSGSASTKTIAVRSRFLPAV